MYTFNLSKPASLGIGCAYLAERGSKVKRLCITVQAKTSHIHTQTEIYFVVRAYGFTK